MKQRVESNELGKIRAGLQRMETERRNYIRPEALNLLDYLCIDEQGRQGEYSMGRTLNVSEGGILMETHIALQPGTQVMITMGIENNLVDIMGRVVHSEHGDGRHLNGIQFFHVADNDKKVLRRYIAAFNRIFPSTTPNASMN